MGRNPTTAHRTWATACLWPLVLATACTVDPDPGEVSRELRLAAVSPRAADEVRLAEPVSLADSPPAAAPLAEVGSREAAPQRRPFDLAFGRGAAEFVDPAATAAFAAACPDLHGTFLGSSEREALNLVLAGRTQCALVRSSLTARDLHAGLRQTQVGLELFALAVPTGFPAHSLSRRQMQLVLTGQVTRWPEVGIDAGPIVVVVPAAREIAERASQMLLHGAAFAAGATPADDEEDLARELGRAGAIGVVRATEPQAPGRRLLSIDWVPPSAAAHANGNYPYAIPLHMVTSGPPMGRARQFLEFLQSPAGRDHLGRTLLLP